EPRARDATRRSPEPRPPRADRPLAQELTRPAAGRPERPHRNAVRVSRRRGRRVRARCNDPPRARREGARRGTHGRDGFRVIVEIHGLEVFGHHGAGEEERRRGQSFLYDVTIELADPQADELESTVDYRAVRDTVREVSDKHEYKLLESLTVAA